MNDWTLQFLALCWAAFLLTMLVASFRVKRTVEYAGWGWRIVTIAIAAMVIVYLRSGQLLTRTAGPELWSRTLPIELLLTKQFPDAYPRYKAQVKALIPHVL